MKRGIAWQTLIMALIALLVFAIVGYIFYQQTRDIPSQLSQCEKQGGTCQYTDCPDTNSPLPYRCGNTTKSCCSKESFFNFSS